MVMERFKLEDTVNNITNHVLGGEFDTLQNDKYPKVVVGFYTERKKIIDWILNVNWKDTIGLSRRSGFQLLYKSCNQNTLLIFVRP